MAKETVPKVQKVELSKIDAPRGRIRLEISDEYIKELAQSISEVGLIQPILLRKTRERYEIVAGECRYRAHVKMETKAIDAIVKSIPDRMAAIIRASENLKRQDLSPLEEAATYQDLIEEHGMKIETVANKFGITPGTIKRRLDILKMNPMLQKAVHRKEISMSVAEELWPIANDTDLEYYLSFAVENGVTKAVARQWTKDWRDKQRREATPGVEGGVEASPQAPRPIFLACDTCHDPVELGKDILLRICPKCDVTIKEALK